MKKKKVPLLSLGEVFERLEKAEIFSNRERLSVVKAIEEIQLLRVEAGLYEAQIEALTAELCRVHVMTQDLIRATRALSIELSSKDVTQ
jgi:hypothetical protein